MDTVVCGNCGKPAEYSHTQTNSKGKFEIHYCPNGHETKVQVEVHKEVHVKPFPKR